MIAHVFGTVAEKFNDSIVVDTGGVGYEIYVAASDFERFSVGGEAKIYTYHHVREQAEELFGFSSLAAKKLFQLLITVQGVGPKAALAILSLGEAEIVRNAIANADHAFIQKAAGVGKKTAERVVVDLSDKVGVPAAYDRADSLLQTSSNTANEALEALVALGYTLADATRALEGVDPALPTAERVTRALRG
ncbi:Holliday junction branch migration protein RuvA [TM7 phylum sp. oral taxon 349]|nr:Holliday junction branch migration protein RuvA [TM7 phylum sp. oral taxon 349]